MNQIIETLLSSEEPSIRYKIRVGVFCENPDSLAIRNLQTEVKRSPRVRSLLAKRDKKGHVRPVQNPYSKWNGAHWVLATLADIGYPCGDKKLIPIRDQVLDCWLHADSIREQVYAKPPRTRRGRGIPVIQGRARCHASQQGNALYSAVVLGLMDKRCDRLAEHLIQWQWPDGGWNCDLRAEATNSSFWESLIPFRGLSRFGEATGNEEASTAATRAAEVFLKRHLYRRIANGQIMNGRFVKLHYPCYWRYDILFGLKAMAEAGFINDSRCSDALDLLESKQLPEGGWPAEERFYGPANSQKSGCDLVSWGGVSKTRPNEWVTADALYVLRAAGRLTM